MILKKSSSRGPRRLEKYTDEKSSLIGHGCKQIDLSHMSEIAKLPPDMKKHTLAISCLDGTSRQLSFDSGDLHLSYTYTRRQSCKSPSSLQQGLTRRGRQTWPDGLAEPSLAVGKMVIYSFVCAYISNRII